MEAQASCAYNEPFMVQLDGDIDLRLLRQSIQTVLARHEALNLRFSTDGDYQQKGAAMPVEIPLVDLSHVAATEIEQTLNKTFVEIGTTPFDLTNGPLVRVQILKLAGRSHTILFSCHHIVCDGWSWNLMLREMGQVYNATTQGKTYNFARTFNYSNFVVTEIQRQNSESVKKSYVYWVEQFAELPQALELPLDRPRPAVKTFSGGTVTYHFDSSVYEGIKRVAASQRASLFSTLFASFNLLLARLSGQNDIVMTVPSAGQLNIGQTNLVGHCVNLLPVRTGLDMRGSFSEFLAGTTTNLLDAYDHQDATLGGIVNRLNMPRNASRMPLAEVNFNVDRDDAGVQFGNAEVHVAQTPKQAVVFEIFFNINETREGLKVDCDFNTDLYDHATIARWIGYFETLLQSIIENPDETLSKLEILPDDARQMLISGWNDTATAYPMQQGIHDLFMEQAAQTPDLIAVQHEARSYTYRELNERSNQLANHLLSRGVGIEDFVGLFVGRSADMLVGLLGILKAGGAYVPMDPDFPNQRVSYMIADAQMKYIVTEQSLTDSLGSTQAGVICLDGDWQTIAAQPTTAPAVTVEPENLAHVIYTSGSTGDPKGVQIKHKSLTNLIYSLLEQPGIGPNDVVLGMTTVSFDIAALELFTPIICGGKVVIVGREIATDGFALAESVEKYEITVLQATPTSWRMLVEAGWQGQPNITMITGGEALTTDLAKQLVPLGGKLWNMYAPSESTIYSTIQHVASADETITIGVPLANTQIYLLNDELQLVPPGTVGTIYIGGTGISRGYLNQDAMTAERFISNPFSDEAAERIYNTGDLARYLADGQIEYLGRNDSQVKLRGYRIELGEIESMLGRHPDILQNAVIVREDTPGNKQLVAYYILEERSTATWAELRHYLGEYLPDYMIPVVAMGLDAMPKTPNGKIDRKALPMPTDLRSGVDDTTYVAPTTQTEQEIVEIWQTVMGLDKVGIHDNFFDLGGHSLHATRVLARLRNDLNVEVPLRTMFTTPTVAGLSAAVTELLAVAEDDGDLEAMLSEIEDLSENELKALLEE
mgnify:CR=1 FL=1